MIDPSRTCKNCIYYLWQTTGALCNGLQILPEDPCAENNCQDFESIIITQEKAIRSGLVNWDGTEVHARNFEIVEDFRQNPLYCIDLETGLSYITLVRKSLIVKLVGRDATFERYDRYQDLMYQHRFDLTRGTLKGEDIHILGETISNAFLESVRFESPSPGCVGMRLILRYISLDWV